MKVEVLEKFIDKETGKVRNVGDVFEVTGERFDEIERSGRFVKKIKIKKKKDRASE